MIRGTTPTHTFVFPLDGSEYSAIYVTYVQKGTTVLEKTEEDMTFDGNVGSYTLTQTETLAFSPDNPVEIQVRAKTTGGAAMASAVVTIPVGDILKAGVI
ncbi:MAG: hypothetical protein KBS76_03770 [Ruminococcus sp.]|nr:hypothetical protein [Candidatus Apopatosoma intestinale]